MAGGLSENSKGMELWNPMDDSLGIVTDVLPPEEGRTSGLQNAQLVKWFLQVMKEWINKSLFLLSSNTFINEKGMRQDTGYTCKWLG